MPYMHAEPSLLSLTKFLVIEEKVACSTQYWLQLEMIYRSHCHGNGHLNDIS